MKQRKPKAARPNQIVLILTFIALVLLLLLVRLIIFVRDGHERHFR